MMKLVIEIHFLLMGRQWIHFSIFMDVGAAGPGGPCDNLILGGATKQFLNVTHELQNVSPELAMHMKLLMSFEHV